jgi:hypothetical protein
MSLRSATTARRSGAGRAALLVAIPAALALAGCGGGSSRSALPAFECDDAAPAADTVALRCGPALGADARIIEVVIGVPTASTDIYSASFYLAFDPAVLVFEPGSAVAGSLLTRDGATVLVEARLFENEPGLIAAGIARTGIEDGVRGVPGHEVILSFVLRAVPGARFEASMPEFLDPRVSDSDFQPIAGIVFSDQLLLSAR